MHRNPKERFLHPRQRKNSGQILCIAQSELVQTTPDAYLIAVVVAGDALICVDRGSVHIGVCRASCRLTVGTVGAAVGGFAVEPNQPSAVDLGNLGDLPLVTSGIGRSP